VKFRDVGGGVALHSSAYHRVTQVRGGRAPCRWNCKTSNPVGRPGSVGVRRPTVSASAPRFLAAGRRYRQPEPPGPRLRPCRPSTMPGRAWSSLVFAGLVGFCVRATIFPGSMRIYLNHSLNKHYTGGTRVTIRRQLPIVRPGCWQQHKLVGTRPQGVPGPGGLSPRGPKFWSGPILRPAGYRWRPPPLR